MLLIPFDDAADRFRELAEAVALNGAEVVITRDGAPYAVLSAYAPKPAAVRAEAAMDAWAATLQALAAR